MRLDGSLREHGAVRERTLYVIRNARLDPEWAEVDRRTLPIAMRAISCLIQYQGIGDLYRIYTITQRDGVDYNLAYIPAEFKTPHTADFDPAYMGQLFDFGYQMAGRRHRVVERAADPGFPTDGDGEPDTPRRPTRPIRRARSPRSAPDRSAQGEERDGHRRKREEGPRRIERPGGRRDRQDAGHACRIAPAGDDDLEIPLPLPIELQRAAAFSRRFVPVPARAITGGAPAGPDATRSTDASSSTAPV